MQTKPKNISPMDSKRFSERIKSMNMLVEEAKENVENLHVYISKGNSKTNELVPSVSLVPVRCCPNCSSCSKLCYDVRNDCVYDGVRKTRAINTAILEKDHIRYFCEIANYVRNNNVQFFRWHIGGDIVNMEYFRYMIAIAERNPKVKFLAFTKNFDVVNSYLDKGNEIPSNLQVIFSDWVGQDTPNPHRMPTSNPVFADGSTTARYGAFYCTGNCSECALTHTGCWYLNKGEQVAFLAH